MPAVVAAPDELTQTCVLLLLHEHPMGCEELSARLHRAGVLDDDRAWTDRVLQALTARGIVQVAERAGDGDPVGYELTPAGVQRLGDAADDLRSTRALLDRFLARSGEWIVLRGGGAGPA
jgi:DNA-binding PadR family transcriptional regulator